MSEIVLNKYGCNSAIKIHILPDDQMKLYGFKSIGHPNAHWYWSRSCIDEIYFSLSINKVDPEDWRIDIIDEDFLQPYDYQHMLDETPTFSYALKVQKRVEQFMQYLAEIGVVSGHNFGDYI